MPSAFGATWLRFAHIRRPGMRVKKLTDMTQSVIVWHKEEFPETHTKATGSGI